MPAQPDADLLTSVLDEVIYRLDTDGEIPIDVQITATDDALIVRFTMADADSIRPIGAVPEKRPFLFTSCSSLATRMAGRVRSPSTCDPSTLDDAKRH